MTVFISYDLSDGPHGGGNQFLKILKKTFEEKNIYREDPKDADVILYNGHQFIEQTVDIKNKYPDKKFVHRMDGLQKLYNHKDDTRQDLAISFNKMSNGTIFQSKWAQENFYKFNFRPEKSCIIPNAADPEIFNYNHGQLNPKTNLLCTSFSPNIKKGFGFYQKLDDLLDFDRYNFTFIGNKPQDINYKNINCLPPKTSREISKHLHKTDIFVSATVDDCCSNSIIEALSSGVPVFAQNSGGNPELVKDGGLLFNDTEDFLKRLEMLRMNIDFYRKSINIKSISEVADDYVEFFKCI